MPTFAFAGVVGADGAEMMGVVGLAVFFGDALRLVLAEDLVGTESVLFDGKIGFVAGVLGFDAGVMGLVPCLAEVAAGVADFGTGVLGLESSGTPPSNRTRLGVVFWES